MGDGGGRCRAASFDVRWLSGSRERIDAGELIRESGEQSRVHLADSGVDGRDRVVTRYRGQRGQVALDGEEIGGEQVVVHGTHADGCQVGLAEVIDILSDQQPRAGPSGVGEDLSVGRPGAGEPSGLGARRDEFEAVLLSDGRQGFRAAAEPTVQRSLRIGLHVRRPDDAIGGRRDAGSD